jgi:hypothetical protein
MTQHLWHVVWGTAGAWPPSDKRGDWSDLSEFYAPLIADGSIVPSSPLPAQYTPQGRGFIIRLSQDDAAFLRERTLELTKADGDRVAGGHPVLTSAFMPTEAHVLFRCERDTLRQVVGRLKSRLATLLLNEPRWSKVERIVWDRGFWAGEVVKEDLAPRIKEFIESNDLHRLMVPESERPAYFHPEELTVAELEAEFDSGDADRAYAAFLNAAYFHEAAWVQTKSLGALASPIATVRMGGLAALQILTAVRKELEPLVVVPAVTSLLDDPDEHVCWKANSVLEDIRSFFGQ